MLSGQEVLSLHFLLPLSVDIDLEPLGTPQMAEPSCPWKILHMPHQKPEASASPYHTELNSKSCRLCSRIIHKGIHATGRVMTQHAFLPSAILPQKQSCLMSTESEGAPLLIFE